MSIDDTPQRQERPDEHRLQSDPTASTERYETDEGVVFYDAENPLAWLLARQTLRLADMA